MFNQTLTTTFKDLFLFQIKKKDDILKYLKNT